MVGVSYKVADNNTVFAGYRYFGTTDLSTSYNESFGRVSQKGDLQSHSIDVGYRMDF